MSQSIWELCRSFDCGFHIIIHKIYCTAADVKGCLFSLSCKQCVWVAYYLRDQYVRA